MIAGNRRKNSEMTGFFHFFFIFLTYTEEKTGG